MFSQSPTRMAAHMLTRTTALIRTTYNWLIAKTNAPLCEQTGQQWSPAMRHGARIALRHMGYEVLNSPDLAMLSRLSAEIDPQARAGAGVVLPR